MIPTFCTALAILPLSGALLHAGHEPHHEKGAHTHSADQGADWKRPAASETPVYVGEGAHRYRWDSNWLQLPAGRDWLGSTHGCIVMDKADRVYMSADSGPAVLVVSPDGKIERTFGDDWGSGLHGLTIVEEDGKEVLYMAHTSKQEVLKTTLTGEVLLRVGPPPTSTGLYENPGHYRPTSVAVGPDGMLFVADGYGLSWIHRYDKTGKYIDSFGGRGKESKHLKTPHGLWMDSLTNPPTLLVADRENHRIARFSLAGEFLGGTDPASGLLRRPCHLQFHGKVAVVSDLAGRTTLLNSKLELIGHLGDNPDPSQRAQYNIIPNLWRDGIFFAPHCARFNSKGDLFVMDWNVAGRMTRLVHVDSKPENAK